MATSDNRHPAPPPPPARPAPPPAHPAHPAQTGRPPAPHTESPADIAARAAREYVAGSPVDEEERAKTEAEFKAKVDAAKAEAAKHAPPAPPADPSKK